MKGISGIRDSIGGSRVIMCWMVSGEVSRGMWVTVRSAKSLARIPLQSQTRVA